MRGETTKQEDSKKLLSPKAGYFQHTSPHQTKGFEKANVASAALKFKLD